MTRDELFRQMYQPQRHPLRERLQALRKCHGALSDPPDVEPDIAFLVGLAEAMLDEIVRLAAVMTAINTEAGKAQAQDFTLEQFAAWLQATLTANVPPVFPPTSIPAP